MATDSDTNTYTLSDIESFELFDSLNTYEPPAHTLSVTETVLSGRAWRAYECDKIQADIYRAQERRP